MIKGGVCMDKKEELVNAFKDSIEMEEAGREFYIKAAKKCRSELGKRVFEALADDETRHIIAIKKYCETVEKKGAAPGLCSAVPEHRSAKERVIMGRRESELLKTIRSDADELKAYETAMDMENRGYAFYKKAHDSATDPAVIELYEFLLAEEEAHYELVSSTYKYLKNPDEFFAEEEKPIVEG